MKSIERNVYRDTRSFHRVYPYSGFRLFDHCFRIDVRKTNEKEHRFQTGKERDIIHDGFELRQFDLYRLVWI